MWWTTDEEQRESKEPACVFCQIVAGELPSAEVYSDDSVYAFADINPAAPVHVVIVPRQHVTLLAGADEKHEILLGHLLRAGSTVARKTGIADEGYRLAINQGLNAGQLVDHLHLHVLGGHRLGGLGAHTTAM